MRWVDLLQKYLEPLIFLIKLHRLIKRFVPSARPYLCCRELQRVGIYDTSGFVDAARNGRMEELNLFVQSEMSNNIQDPRKERPLIAAAAASHLSAVDLLLDQPGIDANVSNREGDTAMIAAARGGCIEVARALLAHGIDLNLSNNEGETAWIAAIRSRCGEIEREIEARGANRDGVDMWRKRIELMGRGVFTETIFVDRCQMQQLSEVRDFLTAGVNINGRGSSGNTGLIVAAEAGNEKLVELLMEQPKINLNAANHALDTALIVAARRGWEGVVRLLLGREDVNVNARNRAQESALLEAARRDFGNIVSMLEDKNASEPDLWAKVARWKIDNSPHRFEETEFLKLVSQRRRELVELFLKAGISVKAQDGLGNTALTLAAEGDDRSMMELLLDHGAELNTANRRGDTSLIVAARQGREAAVETLVKREGIDLKARNDADESALLEATRRRLDPIVRLLEEAGAKEPDLDKKVARWDIDQSTHRFTEDEFLTQVRHRRRSWVKRFLVAGIELDAKDTDGNTALLLSVGSRDPRLLQLLVDHGVPVNEPNHAGDTALIVAARDGWKEAIAVLLEADEIDVNTKNHADESALLEAAKRGRQEIIDLLKMAGATHANLEQGVARWQLREAGRWSEGEFVLAAVRGKTEEVRLFLLAGMDPNARDLQENTGLILASRSNQIDVVRLLLDQDGINVNARADDDTSALMAAAGRKHEDIVDLLLKAGADRKDMERALRWRLENRGHRFDAGAFVRMAAKGQDGLVSLYLDAGMAVDAADEDGNTALILAAGEGEKKIVRILLERGAAVDLRSRGGSTALEVAMRKGHEQVAELLKLHGAAEPQAPAIGLLSAIEVGDADGVRKALESGASPDQRNESGEPALVTVIRLSRWEIATLLLERGADAEARDASGKTPLMVAAELGWLRLAEILLDRGVAVDATTPNGSTALMLAAWQGQTEMVKLLADKGADVNREDSAARRPLTAALVKEHGEVGRILEGRGAEQGADQAALLRAAERGDINRVRELLSEDVVLTAQDDQGNTPLMLAAARGWPKTVKALVGGGGVIDLTNSSGDTALMLAAAAGREAVVEVLIEAGAGINLRNLGGRTALLQAAAAGKGKVVKLLATRGAKPSLSADGTTPLVEACRYGPVEVVQALITAGADVDQQVDFGTSALMAATLSGQEGIVELLEAEEAKAGREEARLFRCVRMGDEQGLQQGLQELDLKKVDLKARDERGRTVLLEAADRGQAAIVDLLLGVGASPDVQDLNGDTALMLAAASGSLPALALLVKATERDEKKDTAALLAAAERGFAAAAGFLVEKSDARINGIGSGRVPLVVAAARGHLEVVATLLDLEADKDKRAANGQTALTAARLHGHEEIVDFLQSRGAKAATGEVEFLVAAADGDLVTLRRLLAEPDGARLDARDELGRTALMRACEKHRIRVVEILLEYWGSDLKRRAMIISATDLRGRTPLMWAAVGGDRQIVSLLIQHGATLGTPSKKGRAALIEACHFGWLEVVEEILDAMEDDDRQSAVNTKDKVGNTPLGEAFLMAFVEREHDYLRIVDLLERYGAELGRDEKDLLDAARLCDPEKLLKLVERVEVDSPRRKGKTALMLSVEADCAEGAQILVDAGADVNQRGPFGATPLILAARAGKLVGLRFLLEEHAEYDLRDNRGETALFAAVKAGRVQVVGALIVADVHVDLTDLQGRTPLMQAVLDDRPDLVGQLLDAEASNDRVDDYGRTALTLAHLRGRSTGLTEETPETDWLGLTDMGAIERLLLASGTQRGWNEAELLLAARAGDGDGVMRILEKSVVVVHAPDLGGSTALLWACHYGDGRLARKLMDAGANPDVSNDEGRTPLMEAVAHGDSILVKALLRPGLNLDAQDKVGDTALLMAATRGDSDLVTVLVTAGADVNIGNRKRQTPLLASVRHPDLAAVRCLLDRGANACGRGSDHRTAIMEAAARGDEAMLETLLKHVDMRLRDSAKTAYLNAVARVEGAACTALDLAEKGGHQICVRLLSRYGGEPVRLTGYTVYLTEFGDYYHRYECGACAYGRRRGTLKEIEIDSPRLRPYPPCDRCNPSYRELNFDWSC